MREPMTIHIWSDIACPWCYVGKRHLEAAIVTFVEHDTPPIDVMFHSFQLSPDLPETFEGSAEEFLARHKGLGVERARRLQEHVAGVAAQAGLRFDFGRQRIANTRKAHELLHLALPYGLQYDLKERLFAAHFCEGRDLGDDDALVSLAAEVGLPDAEVRAALQDRRFGDAVDEDVQLARDLNVSGVPFFVIDRRFGVSGAQAPEVFVDVLRQAMDRRGEATG